MVLPAAITTLLIGVTVGITLYMFTNMFSNPSLYEEPQRRHNPNHYEEPQRRHNPNHYEEPQRRQKKSKFRADDNCPICMDRFGSINHVEELRCGHFLHKKCYEELIEHFTDCPLCRKYIA